MRFGYAQPFKFELSPARAPEIVTVRNGVTEIVLSDGRTIRASLDVKSVAPNHQKPGAFDISFNIVTEIVAKQDNPVHQAHTTLQ
jgi:hypothetical protein